MVLDKLKSFISRSRRVLNVSHRPRTQEYWMMAKTVSVGMVLIGLAGFVITIVFSFVDRGGF
ncbi:Uncharacterised protein [Candidatus Burarchaeum australiense]|nr:Uncharacterised protein [Candidatus Burarchaeum australiense]